MKKDEGIPPKRGPPERRAGDIDCLFETADVIHTYTSKQAVEDGVLFDVNELSKLSPSIKWGEGPFQYVTTNLATSKGYLKEGSEPSVPNFLDLFNQVGQRMQRPGPKDYFYQAMIEFPDGTRGEVYAKQNETGRYTILLPEDD
jgi:hypothetical protein